MPTSPMPDWISIYADFNRAAPIPVQTLANYADVTVVAGTLIVLNEILDKCKTMPVQPKTIVTVHVPYRELVKRDGAGAPRRWQTTALPR